MVQCEWKLGEGKIMNSTYEHKKIEVPDLSPLVSVSIWATGTKKTDCPTVAIRIKGTDAHMIQLIARSIHCDWPNEGKPTWVKEPLELKQDPLDTQTQNYSNTNKMKKIQAWVDVPSRSRTPYYDEQCNSKRLDSGKLFLYDSPKVAKDTDYAPSQGFMQMRFVAWSFCLSDGGLVAVIKWERTRDEEKPTRYDDPEYDYGFTFESLPPSMELVTWTRDVLGKAKPGWVDYLPFKCINL
jgi:hypothetical protein